MVMFYDQDNKMRDTERKLHIRPIEGQKIKATTGLVDSRLFKGEQVLIAHMDPQTCLWTFKYKMGILPEPLREKFTSFNKLYQHGQTYFKKRGLHIVEVND